MTVADRDQIDLVTESPDGTITLIMVEDRDLIMTPSHVEDAIAKLNLYATLILDGTIVEVVPEAKNRPVEVRYETITDPETSPKLMELLAGASGMFKRLGSQLLVTHLNIDEIGQTDAG